MTRELDVGCAIAVLRSLGTLVFRTRRERGVTREHVAREVGLSLGTLRNVETRPGYVPNGDTVLALLTWIDRGE